MPPGWQDEAQRVTYYHVVRQPVTVTSFLDPLRERLTQALVQFNLYSALLQKDCL
jgi:hypothetical protein